jgi:hypothetical protein
MLSEIAIRAAKPREKPCKLSDERGLYLLGNPNGSRWWRFKYSRFGKERGLSLGVYPDVTLAMARKRRDEARTQLADGIDPSHKRKAEKLSNANTFRAIAEEWLALQKDKLHVRTYDKAKYQLESFVYPRLGDTPITKITAPDLLAALRKVEVRGAHETAHRTKQRCGQIFRYAIATGRAETDVSVHLRGALAPVVTNNRAALIDPAEVGQLLRAIEGYSAGTADVRSAERAAAGRLVRVRPRERGVADPGRADEDG